MAAYLVEAGLLLIVAPWTGLWDRNFFARVLPWLGGAMENTFVRGGVSGLGLVTLAAGLRDLAGTFLTRNATASGGRQESGPA